MSDDKKKKDSSDNAEEISALENEIEKLKTKLSESRMAEEKAVCDLDVVKKQAKATEKEYDRLMVELEAAQKELASGDKKDE